MNRNNRRNNLEKFLRASREPTVFDVTEVIGSPAWFKLVKVDIYSIVIAIAIALFVGPQDAVYPGLNIIEIAYSILFVLYGIISSIIFSAPFGSGLAFCLSAQNKS